MEAIRSFEMSVYIQTTWLYMPEDGSFITTAVRTPNPTTVNIFCSGCRSDLIICNLSSLGFISRTPKSSLCKVL